MKPRFSMTLLLTGACSVLPLAHAADELTLPATQIQTTAQQQDSESQGYQGKPASSTTRLGLSEKQTPQAITTITREQLEDFRLNSVKDALRSAPSVTVEQTETDRTSFTSRGFDIDNFEYDGMGMPFATGLLVGDLDLAEYEQVDILHGANGLMSGSGNPSATVNFVRKRPTYETQASIGMSVGSWDNRRVDVDVSGPLTDSGNVRGRFIYANDSGNSWLDRYSHERNVVAGLLAFDLSEADTLTVGYSDTKSNSNGSSWGNLPLVDGAGNLIHYSSRSSSIGQDWTYWDVHTQRAFAEWAHDFGGGWNGTLSVTGVQQHNDTKMYYVLADVGDDVYAYPSHTRTRNNQLLGEAKVSGPFSLFGREHQLTLGASYGRARNHERGYYVSADEYVMGSLASTVAGTVVEPEMAFTSDAETSDFTDRQKSVYAGTRFSLADNLHWIVGARMLSADSEGTDYAQPRDVRIHGKVTPYTGLVYDLNDDYALYASYTKIFNPQYTLGTDGRLLDPLEGHSYEVGVKGSLLDKRLNVTAALFKTEQQNVAEGTGEYQGSRQLYEALDYKSHGLELGAAGEIADGLELNGGYTYVRIDDDNGDRARKYVPTHTVRGSLIYRLPGLPQARVGTRVAWQGAVESDSDSHVRQNAYALVDLMASYDIDSHWSTALNLNNVTDRKYLLSLYQSATTANYGAPRNVTASVSWKF
ncbi:TonB-dependent siderophore receptor [Pseudomonas sp. 3A(2025)]